MWQLVLLAAPLFAAACGGPAAPAVVTVSAAASLSDVLTEVAAAYERTSGTRVALNFGGSNVLARQIRAGAPVDLFISADEAQMEAVAAEIVSGTRTELLSNTLVIAVPADRPAAFASPQALRDPAVRRIAIGEPSSVPAGVYARQYLEHAGLWHEVAPRIVPAGSVRLALAAVENGAADAAIVFRTDVRPDGRARIAYRVPADQGPRIVYPAAVIRTGGNADTARRLLTFLQMPEARAMFVAAGFLVP